jgi:ketosteroid isomerase-like protein
MEPNSLEIETGTEGSVVKFLDALGRRDFEQLEACLAPDVWFRALLPKSQRESHTAHEAATIFRTWFGDETASTVLEAEHRPAPGRVFLSYRLRLLSTSSPGWHVVEQAGFCRIQENRISRLDVVCTGLRPIEVE